MDSFKNNVYFTGLFWDRQYLASSNLDMSLVPSKNNYFLWWILIQQIANPLHMC